MSNNNSIENRSPDPTPQKVQDQNTAAGADTTATANNETKFNLTKKIQAVQKSLYEIDATKGAEAQLLLQEYGSLHADPNPEAKNKDGKTADQLYQEFQEKSAQVGESKKELETELQSLLNQQSSGMTSEQRKAFLDERAKRANAAAQEPVKDMSKFAQPELDRVREELQKNPLSGGAAAAIDDGTGGQGKQQQTKQQQQK